MPLRHTAKRSSSTRDRFEELVAGIDGVVWEADARTFQFTPEHEGDHAYRSGVLRWAVGQGMWGILRATGDGSE